MTWAKARIGMINQRVVNIRICTQCQARAIRNGTPREQQDIVNGGRYMYPESAGRGVQDGGPQVRLYSFLLIVTPRAPACWPGRTVTFRYSPTLFLLLQYFIYCLYLNFS
ncbi:hypothetical protein BYT27DRAFT_6433720 [Phlegmacium glaucopus]|nr:hypothetical protein BYT27DRAFT_6433720 [Phlegmacium glaucopus]